MPEGNAIGFNTFVDKATRSVNDPSYTNASMFDDFAVFGYVEGAVLFDGTRVAKENLAEDQTKTGWEYEGTQYWIAGANYNFNAVAPKTGGNWTVVKKDADDNVVTNASQTTISFTNDGTTDLLYATTAQEGKVSGNLAVEFNFRHVLSKVKFSFENAYNATNATIKVKNVEIKNAHLAATATLTSTTAWSAQAGSVILNFGDATDREDTTNVDAYAFGSIYESVDELLLIPGAAIALQDDTNAGYKVTFDVELYIGEALIKTYNHVAYADFTPEAGKCYDIKTAINASNIDPQHKQEPIEFTVATLPGWGTTNDVEADGDYDPTPEQTI